MAGALNRKGFYKTVFWRRISEAMRARDGYMCQRCLLLSMKRKGGRAIGPAEEVHHIDELKDGDDYFSKSTEDNLVSLCHLCHNHITAVSHGYQATARISFDPSGEVEAVSDPEPSEPEDAFFYGASTYTRIQEEIRRSQR